MFKPLHRNENFFLGVFLIVISRSLFAIQSTLVKIVSVSTQTYKILFFENFFSLLLILPFVLYNGLQGVKTDQFKVIFLRCIFGFASSYCLFLALKHIELIDATMLASTAPLFIPLIFLMWIRKRIDKYIWLGIALGFVGVLIVLRPDREVFNIYVLIGLLAGIFSALLMSTIRILHREPFYKIIFYYHFISCLILAPIVIYFWSPLSIETWKLLIWIGVLMFVFQIFLTFSFKYACAADLAPFNYVYIVAAGFIQWMLWDLPPSLISILGACLIIVSGIISIIRTNIPPKDVP